jgi:hypothetical protein
VPVAVDGAAVAVTQAPTLTAAAVVARVWVNLVVAPKLTVTCPFCVLWTKMLAALTAEIVPDAPGRAAVPPAACPAPPEAAGAGAWAAALLVLPPQPATTATVLRATAGSQSLRGAVSDRVRVVGNVADCIVMFTFVLDF